MLSYNTRNDDYALMNYIVAGLCLLTLLLPIATYRKYQSNIKSLPDDKAHLTTL